MDLFDAAPALLRAAPGAFRADAYAGGDLFERLAAHLAVGLSVFKFRGHSDKHKKTQVNR
jgi:hypothetical protein